MGNDLDSLIDSFSRRGWLRVYWDSNNIGVAQVPNVLGINMGTGYPQDGPLWFIRDLMVMFVLSPFFYWILRKFKVYSLLLVGGGYIFNIWLPLSGFSSTSVFFFMTGAWLMMKKKDPIEEFGKIKLVLLIGTLILLISTTLLYNNNATYYDISMRMFRLFAIPLAFIWIAYLLDTKKIKINESLSGCSFFIFAAHYYFSFRAIEHFIGILQLRFLDKIPFIRYIFVASCSLLMLVLIKQIIDKYTPKLSSLLNGCR